MTPAREGDQPPQSPEAVYAAMTPEERSKAGWSKAEQEAKERFCALVGDDSEPAIES